MAPQGPPTYITKERADQVIHAYLSSPGFHPLGPFVYLGPHYYWVSNRKKSDKGWFCQLYRGARTGLVVFALPGERTVVQPWELPNLSILFSPVSELEELALGALAEENPKRRVRRKRVREQRRGKGQGLPSREPDSWDYEAEAAAAMDFWRSYAPKRLPRTGDRVIVWRHHRGGDLFIPGTIEEVLPSGRGGFVSLDGATQPTWFEKEEILAIIGPQSELEALAMAFRENPRPYVPPKLPKGKKWWECVPEYEAELNQLLRLSSPSWYERQRIEVLTSIIPKALAACEEEEERQRQALIDQLARLVTCPRCGAPPRSPCRRSDGRLLPWNKGRDSPHHLAREERAAEVADNPLLVLGLLGGGDEL